MKPIEPGAICVIVATTQCPTRIKMGRKHGDPYNSLGRHVIVREMTASCGCCVTVDAAHAPVQVYGYACQISNLRRIDDDPDAETTPADERQEVDA